MSLPDGTENDAPLSISDAANAYAGMAETTEPDEGQTEVEEIPEGEIADEEELPADEAGEDEPEGEPEDEGQAENDDDEPDSDQGRFVSPNGKVRLPDGSVVPVSELISGNLRDRDYRQKTMEVAETRRSVEAQSLAVKQREEKLTEQAEFVTSLVKSILPATPDPSQADPRSPNYDPLAYQAAKAAYDHWQGHLTYLQQQQQQSAQERQAEAARGKQEKARSEWAALLEKAPELKDEARLKGFVKDLEKYAPTYGFTPEEIKEQLPIDHRMSVVLRKAIRWDKLQESKTKVAAKVEGRPPVQKGGTRLDPTRAKARDGRAAMDRLNSSGKLADGVAALLALEGKG